MTARAQDKISIKTVIICILVQIFSGTIMINQVPSITPGMSSLFWVLFLFVSFFALPVLLVVPTLLGLADVWLDLRRLRKEQGPEEQEA